MNKRDPFLRSLHKKVYKKVDPQFEKEFWKHFDEIFPKRSPVERIRELLFSKYSFGVVGACALVLVFLHFKYSDIPIRSEIMAIMEKPLLYKHLDLFASLETIQLSDQEWKELLKDDNL